VQYAPDTPLYRLLATRYEPDREQVAITILDQSPELARLEWPGPDRNGQPFVQRSSALHYVADDGKLALVRKLIECGADVNASNARRFRSVLSWGANNARMQAISLLFTPGPTRSMPSTRPHVAGRIAAGGAKWNTPRQSGSSWKPGQIPMTAAIEIV